MIYVQLKLRRDVYSREKLIKVNVFSPFVGELPLNMCNIILDGFEINGMTMLKNGSYSLSINNRRTINFGVCF